jgi:calmodulin
MQAFQALPIQTQVEYEDTFDKLKGTNENLPSPLLEEMLRLMGLTVTPEEVAEYAKLSVDANDVVTFASLVDIYDAHAVKQSKHFDDFLAFFNLIDVEEKGYVKVSDMRHALCNLGNSLTDQEFNHMLYSLGMLHKLNITVYEFIRLMMNTPLESRQQ